MFSCFSYCIQLKYLTGTHTICVYMYRHDHTQWIDNRFLYWFFTCGFSKDSNMFEMGTNTVIANEQQSASAALSQPCLSCLEDILWFLLFEYLLHTLKRKKKIHSVSKVLSAFLPFYFITGAEYRTLPQWHGCHRPMGSLRIQIEALLRLFNVVLSLLMTLFFISSETSAFFFFYITKCLWCGDETQLNYDADMKINRFIQM